MASSCPTTRMCNSVSRLSSFCFSLWSMRLTGMPVHRETTSAISSASTSSLTMADSFCSSWSFFFKGFDGFFCGGDGAVADFRDFF